MPGPVPKRSELRRRANKPEVPITRAQGAEHVEPPAMSREWHVSARRWFKALKESGQAQFFEPSDWALAQWVCDLLTAEMTQDRPPRAAMVGEISSLMDQLLTSEGARRRLRVELVRQAAKETSEEKLAPVIPLPSQLYG